MPDAKKKIAILFHYMQPDDVAGSPQFSLLARSLAKSGWQVEAFPCNRSSRRINETYPVRQTIDGVKYNRIWRPPFGATGIAQRFLAAMWMMFGWLRIAFRRQANLPDVLLVGSEPIFGILAAWLIKKIRPSVRIVHWCFDLYPEILSAAGRISEKSIAIRILRTAMSMAYRTCDAICDSGPCMRRKLEEYPTSARRETFAPWAIGEPSGHRSANPDIRRKIFGDAKPCLLYSGNFGLAHTSHSLLKLAGTLAQTGGKTCFAVRGHKVSQLAKRIEHGQAELIDFADEANLIEHLSAADFHLASLDDKWSGLVVPSKFFGSLAAGRPVIYSGPPDSSISIWIKQYEVGWVLTDENAPQVADDLRRLAQNESQMQELQRRCRDVYDKYFSSRAAIEKWISLLDSVAGK